MQLTIDDLVDIKRLDMDCYGVRLSSDCKGVFSVSGPNGGKVVLYGSVRAEVGIHVRQSTNEVLLGTSRIKRRRCCGNAACLSGRDGSDSTLHLPAVRSGSTL